MKYLYLIAFASFISCSKTTKCETWQFYDQCIPKNASVVCGQDPPNTSKLCGDALSGASPGAEKVIKDDANVKIVRHFIQRM